MKPFPDKSEHEKGWEEDEEFRALEHGVIFRSFGSPQSGRGGGGNAEIQVRQFKNRIGPSSAKL